MEKEILELSLGDLVSGARKLKGWTVKEVIDRLFQAGKTISPAYITRIEQYGEIPSPDLMPILADILNLDVKKMISCAKQAKLKKMNKDLDEKYSRALSTYQHKKTKG